MKKFILSITLLIFAFGMFACLQTKQPTIQNTFKQTPLNLIEEYAESSKEVTKITYYEMSDGT